MAEITEEPIANYLLLNLTGDARGASVHLLPKTTHTKLLEAMRQARTMFPHSSILGFILGGEPSILAKGGYHLRKVEELPPARLIQSLVIQADLSWLGKTSRQIDDDIDYFLRELREARLRRTSTQSKPLELEQDLAQTSAE